MTKAEQSAELAACLAELERLQAERDCGVFATLRTKLAQHLAHGPVLVTLFEINAAVVLSFAVVLVLAGLTFKTLAGLVVTDAECRGVVALHQDGVVLTDRERSMLPECRGRGAR